jgi:hypothetical protein
MFRPAKVSASVHVRAWPGVSTVQQVYAASKDSSTWVVTLGDVWSFYNTSEVFWETTHLTRVVFPTQQYVEHMHNNYSDWEQKIYEASVKFLDVCVHDNRGEEQFSMKEYVRLAKDLVLCGAMETKWSPKIRHKLECSCPLFFCKGQCKHVVVLAMLADPTTVLLPQKSDLKQVRSRAGKKCGRPSPSLSPLPLLPSAPSLPTLLPG